MPVTTSTLFALASITKTFTSAAILSLVEEQKFVLDDSVVELLPQLPKAWSPVTIRHCLSHTSGLPDSVTTPGGGDVIADAQDEVLSKLAVMPFKSPGESVSCNQTGYMLLKMIIERVSGKKFELFLEDRFFKPFGMSNTRFGDYRDLIPRRVSIYTKLVPSLDRRSALPGPIDPDDLFSGVVFSPDKIFKEAYLYPRYSHGSAGLNSTILDMAKWDAALSSGSVISDASLEETGTAFQLQNGENGLFGLGWAVRERRGHKVMQMGGGWLTWHLRVPNAKLSVIVLTNLQGSERGEIANGIADLYLASSKSG